MIHEMAQYLVDTIFEWGYIGIFIMMTIESSFIPFPSEIVLVPAGYLASKGEMSVSLIMLTALAGALLGALINYYLAYSMGRKFLLRYGEYFFIKKSTLLKMEEYFCKHGHISTFTGRLIPGVRQLISIPAGLAKMNITQFSLFTALGAAIWAFILIMLGYFIGENEALIKIYLQQITITVIIFLVVVGVIYYRYQKQKG
jgi:membrane protein DedA with SNARE-associated domain